MQSCISIKGARENNLKNINVDIPKSKLIVLTGLSGSGKSTLAFNILQRECQRQYMESMGIVTDFYNKPKVDSIVGLSPSISVEQQSSNNNPRSTVGTMTDIFTYVRILFAKLGKQKCSNCGEVIQQNYEIRDIDEDYEVKCSNCHTENISLTMSHFSSNKPEGACSTCSGLGIVSMPNIDLIIDHEKSIYDGAIYGWDAAYISRYTESLENAGKHYGFEIDTRRPIKEYNDKARALLLYGTLSSRFSRHFLDIAPPKTVPAGRYEGVITNLMRRYKEQKSSSTAKKNMEKLLTQETCSTCNGKKYKGEILSITLGGFNIVEISQCSLLDMLKWIKDLHNHCSQQGITISQSIIINIEKQVERLIDIGLGYLSLDRTIITLSAGELQRLSLANLLGSGLTGVLYIIDEPTSGLHDSDNDKLLKILKRIRDLGNTVLVVEHDVEIMKAADYIIDMGIGAGKNGGNIIAYGAPKDITNFADSITGSYLAKSNAERIEGDKRSGNGKVIEIIGAKENNLKGINVSIPLGKLVVLTGVSGSGKSTLLFEILANSVENYLNNISKEHNKYETIQGLEFIDDIIVIDQSPIGRSSRSNAATYIDVFSNIRNLFSSLQAAKIANIKTNHFSFNVAGGRCEKCEGAGYIDVSMHFLPSVPVKCVACNGKRFKKEILDIKYRGYSISDVLNLSIEEALEVFHDVPKIASKLKLMKEVGLGYLGLGQPATTLSGGEAQRIKLAKELSKRSTGHTLYLLDEPTTGLHPHDTQKLIKLLNKLVDSQNSVILIEHNLDVISQADWIIDIGPNGGDEGGVIVGTGTPKDIMNVKESKTGQSLLNAFSHKYK